MVIGILQKDNLFNWNCLILTQICQHLSPYHKNVNTDKFFVGPQYFFTLSIIGATIILWWFFLIYLCGECTIYVCLMVPCGNTWNKTLSINIYWIMKPSCKKRIQFGHKSTWSFGGPNCLMTFCMTYCICKNVANDYPLTFPATALLVAFPASLIKKLQWFCLTSLDM